MEQNAIVTHYAAIGQVAVAWARFEMALDTFLGSAAEVTDEVVVCFTGQMIGVRPRIDAFISLVRYRGARKRWNDVLEKFARRAQSLAERRNRVIHDVWIMDGPDCPRRLEATARRQLRMDAIPVPTKELFTLAMDIYELKSDWVYRIADPLLSELRSSRDTGPQLHRRSGRKLPPQDNDPIVRRSPPRASQG
jgi:hypothetical protein